MAEIYDGAAPVMSKGCYAQAWSVGEILRVYKEMEGKKMNAVVKRTPAEWKSFFESEEFVENFTYEGDDLGVSVKKDEQLVTEFPRQPPGERRPKNSFACDDARRKGCLELCIAGSLVWNVLYISHSALRWRF